MMLEEHATHAQSHSSSTQVENFLAGRVGIASVGENSYVIFDGILFIPGSGRRSLFKKQSSERSRCAPTTIILFCRDTSI